MEQRNKAQRLRIGEGRDEEAQKFAQGKGGANFAQGKCVVRISHNALFTRANAKLWWFQMATILGF